MVDSEAVKLVFYFRLPFDLPIPPGTGYAPRHSSNPDDAHRVQMTVAHTHINFHDLAEDPYGHGLASLIDGYDPGNDERSWQTWVLVLTTSRIYREEFNTPSPTREERISIIFERCLAAVNSLIGASQVATKQTMMRTISKEGLDPRIVYEILDQETNEAIDRNFIQVHNKPYNERFLPYSPDEAEHTRIIIGYERRGEAEKKPHPLRVARQLSVEARARLMSGDAMSAILFLQTAVERYLYGIFELTLVDEGESRTTIEEQLKATNFRPLFTKMLPERLGGNWDTNNDQKPAGIYWNQLYDVRNRAVHAGREPHWREVNPAFEAFDELISFVEEQVTKKYKTYPRTLLAIADPGAGGTDNLTAAQRKHVQQFIGTIYWWPEQEN
ncbi:hypothetical protein [Nocardiopsis suaedae]|uniref:Apea-like HEPN domain-containing protein n=1 Tax=Nocardiopsis suaedae TaxID=3018444 RepID=A0ABT4TF29_9ACTN|nr:hypothetical protein [Nocardiopsis suaedae]MDA2803030.1 hypothetical protein [Nocardiopsis suaedae]